MTLVRERRSDADLYRIVLSDRSESTPAVQESKGRFELEPTVLPRKKMPYLYKTGPEQEQNIRRRAQGRSRSYSHLREDAE